MQPKLVPVVTPPNPILESDRLHGFGPCCSLLALVVIIGIVLVATGVVHLNRDAGGNVTVTANPVTVGTENRTIQVPVVTMENRRCRCRWSASATRRPTPNNHRR